MSNVTIEHKVLRDWVAEHVMGFEPKHCQGTLGGINVSSCSGSDGMLTAVSESWFYCDWCGRRIDRSDGRLPCLSYPFPKFTIIDLANKLMEQRRFVFLRTDPLRDRARWTVMIGDSHHVDVDDPLEGLYYILWSEKH